MSYTFRIGGLDFSNIIQRYGYETSYTPVYADTITTLDMVDHTAIIRWRGGLRIKVNPLTEAQTQNLADALSAMPVLTVTYTNLQIGAVVTQQMRLDDLSAALVLQNASRKLLGEIELAFTEL